MDKQNISNKLFSAICQLGIGLAEYFVENISVRSHVSKSEPFNRNAINVNSLLNTVSINIERSMLLNSVGDSFLNKIINYAAIFPISSSIWFFGSVITLSNGKLGLKDIKLTLRDNITKSMVYSSSVYMFSRVLNSGLKSSLQIVAGYLNSSLVNQLFGVVYKNCFLDIILESLVLCPFVCISIHYAYDVSQGMVVGGPIPTPVNPIKKAKKLIQKNGISSLYKGYWVYLIRCLVINSYCFSFNL